ncbi:hypothetical protein SprV_0301367700 [Sparganum proliferum]
MVCQIHEDMMARVMGIADDCALNATSEADVQRSMDLIVATCDNFSLIVNTQKTVIIHRPPSNDASHPAN